MGWLDLLTRTPNPSCRWAWSIPIRRRAVVEHRSRVFQCLPTVEYVQHFRSVDNSTGLSFYLSFFDSVSWKTAFAPRSLDPKVWWSLLQVAVVVECCGHMMNDDTCGLFPMKLRGSPWRFVLPPWRPGGSCDPRQGWFVRGVSSRDAGGLRWQLHPRARRRPRCCDGGPQVLPRNVGFREGKIVAACKEQIVTV